MQKERQKVLDLSVLKIMRQLKRLVNLKMLGFIGHKMCCHPTRWETQKSLFSDMGLSVNQLFSILNILFVHVCKQLSFRY